MGSDSLFEPSPLLESVNLTVPAIADVSIKVSIGGECENSVSGVDNATILCEDCGLYVPASMKCSGALLQPKSPSPFPMAAHEPVPCRVESVRVVAEGESNGKVLDVWLSPVSDDECRFQQAEAGDTLAVLCKNRTEEVTQMLRLLKIDTAKAHRVCRLSSTSDRTLPSHLSPVSSLCHILTHCIQLRYVPSRQLLAALSAFTANSSAKRRLLELSSREGGADYNRLVRGAGLKLMELLSLVPSCCPPIPLLVQMLPPLPPRIYSIAGGIGQRRMRLLVGVIEAPLPGLFSSWLDKCTLSEQRPCDQPGMERFTLDMVTGLLTPNDSDVANQQHQSLCNDLEHLSVRSPSAQSQKEPVVCLYRRSTQIFRPPTDPRRPLVLLAAGTGLAPFLSFLESRSRSGARPETVGSGGSPVVGSAWLVFGCRRTLLAADQLVSARRANVLTRLHVVFSRDAVAETLLHVDDVLRRERPRLIGWILAGAAVYVCGPSSMMTSVKVEVLQALCAVVEMYRRNQLDSLDLNNDLIEMYGEVYGAVGEFSRGDPDGSDEKIAQAILKHMVKLGLYKTDVWC